MSISFPEKLVLFASGLLFNITGGIESFAPPLGVTIFAHEKIRQLIKKTNKILFIICKVKK
jgi:hypothetical protein